MSPSEEWKDLALRVLTASTLAEGEAIMDSAEGIIQAPGGKVLAADRVPAQEAVDDAFERGRIFEREALLAAIKILPCYVAWAGKSSIRECRHDALCPACALYLLASEPCRKLLRDADDPCSEYRVGSSTGDCTLDEARPPPGPAPLTVAELQERLRKHGYDELQAVHLDTGWYVSVQNGARRSINATLAEACEALLDALDGADLPARGTSPGDGSP